MRKVSFVLALLLSLELQAQLASSPTCQSNAYGWRIEKIWNTDQHTMVTLSVCQGIPYTFFFSSGMYIENAGGFGKCMLMSCDNALLDTKYALTPHEVYTFTLSFQRMPYNWTTINIREPNTPGYTAWHWTGIALGSYVPTETGKMERFLAHSGKDVMSGFAHPLTNFRFCRYCINEDKVWLGLFYDGVYTGLEFHRRGNLFLDVDVVDTDRFFSPFLSLQMIRNWILQQDNAKDVISEFEHQLRKAFAQMTGTDLAALVMTIAWNAQS